MNFELFLKGILMIKLFLTLWGMSPLNGFPQQTFAVYPNGTMILPMSLNGIQLCKCMNGFTYTVRNTETGWPAYSYFQSRNSGIFILPQRAHAWANQALYEDVLSETATGADANVCKKKKEKGKYWSRAIHITPTVKLRSVSRAGKRDSGSAEEAGRKVENHFLYDGNRCGLHYDLLCSH